MHVGWYATGRLAAHWGKVGGRDRLAALTGIQGGTLSGYNTGRLKLGGGNAERIAAVLGVSVLDLGAPEVEADESGLTLLGRLEELEGDLAESVRAQARLVRQLAALQARVKKIEARREPDRGTAGGLA